MSDISTKPYMLRAIYEWCTDSGYTPYIAVKVDAATTVPMEYVKKGEIVLNISFGATSGLKMDNDAIAFHARFGGVSREIYVPVANVLAIYANENGQGMAFEVTRTAAELPPQPKAPKAVEAATPTLSAVSNTPAETTTDDGTDPPKKGGRPTLTRIK
jgi:stringent starvation protein B